MSTPATIDFRAFEGEAIDLEQQRGQTRDLATQQGRYPVDAGPAASAITRADGERAMLDYVSAPETIQHAVGVSN